MAKFTKPKNLLVQYKGGGYDGCFWEWNYLLFDAKGKFHDIASSGRNGITQRDAALALMNKKLRWASKDFYTYKLTSRKSLAEFQLEVAATHVAGVVSKVNGIYKKRRMYWECDECSRKQFNDDMHHDGYMGNGGIGVQMLGKLCGDCYHIGLCDSCHEYDSGEKIHVVTPNSDLCCCEWCAESIKKDGVA